jgi:hypothetical protein
MEVYESHLWFMSPMIYFCHNFFYFLKIFKFKAKYNRGAQLGRNHGWVFGLLERGTNVRLFPVENRSAQTLLALIAENVGLTQNITNAKISPAV